MTTVKLDVPYYSQNDNVENPSGSCNVTSMAMCLAYLHPARNYGWGGNGQLEDFLYADMIRRGLSRHNPHDINRWFALNNVRSTFDGCSTSQQIRAHIDRGSPVIVHGYFTSFGHIVTVIGYDATGLIVHDPYGRYPYGDWTSGEAVHYSNGTILATCDHDGIWAHFPRRGDN